MRKLRLVLSTVALCLLFATVALAADVSLEWDANADGQGVLGYYLYWQRSDGSDQAMQATIDGRLTTNVSVPESNFIYGVEYDFWLTAYNSAEESAPSNIVSYTIPWPGTGEPITPDQPAGLRLSQNVGVVITADKIKPAP
jgi:hypothetical protein